MVRGWMDGLHDYCSLPHWTDRLDERRTPGGEVEVLFVGNLEGRPTTVVPSSYAPEGGTGGRWPSGRPPDARRDGRRLGRSRYASQQ